jgi:hypothetical protein
VLAALHADRPAVICVDDAQRLVRPTIGGLDEIDRLVSFAHRVGAPTSWIVGIGAPAWHFLRRARGDRAVFDDVIELGPWNEEQIRELVAARSREAEIEPKFDELVVPRQVLEAQQGEANRTERDYCQILWDYANGNPGVALYFWRESLHLARGQVYVHLFQSPSVLGLEGMPGSMHFVLRAILQLELATEADVVRCTGLHPLDVADALRSARSRKFIENIDGYHRITPRYLRGVTLFLRRQHLVAA